MRIWNRLSKRARIILGSLKKSLGQETIPTSKEIREEVFQQLEFGVTLEGDRKVFPFKKIAIRLQPPTNRILEEYKTDFLKNSLLESDICRFLKDIKVQSTDPEIYIEFLEDRPPVGKEKDSTSVLDMEFLDPFVSAKPEIPGLHLGIIKGTAEQPEYLVSKDRLLMGCLPEVHDLEGRLVRKNDIVFPHEGNEINATVGKMHARIWFDFKKQEFRVMDESSRYGTRIVREGYTIEVPPENPRGVGLRTGDEIHFGQACLRFTVMG